MTLVTRLSLFFLVTLALVLAGFSGTLYALAAAHLSRQVDERLEATLTILAAAAEFDQGLLEWEPHERLLAVGTGDGAPIRWVVTDDHGQRVDGSPNGEAKLFNQVKAAANSDPNMAQEVSWEGERWRLCQRRLLPRKERVSLAEDSPRDQAGTKRYQALDIAVAAPLGPLERTLRTLALVLTALSLGLWLSAALLGRWLCRRALTPLSRMAGAARTITAADPDQRLPDPGTRDELEDLGRAFNDLLARLHESFERQRRFTGDASHQLRTPLTAVLGQIEVVLRRDRAPEEYRRVLTLVQGKAAHLREMVERLLFLARADAEAKLPHLETIDLAAWLPEHLRGWSEHPRSANLKADVPGDGPYRVKAQVPLLGQLVDNLLENACKYSAAGNPVIVRLWREAETIGLTVEDHGTGIDPDDLPHLFEPFYRSPQARRQGLGGVGLGLAVAKRIAEAFNGRIDVKSEPGKGSRFTLRLPRADPPPRDAE
jgi:heavy metal sensor kinase